ncbi:M48 family metallopeptidase [Sphingomonas edaphi]|nr:M48 family metallopeptidase [Sphingomonas edaphi]
MPGTWNGILSTVRSEPLMLPGLGWPVELRVHPRARSLRLRLDEARGVLALTCPRRTSRRAALDWAAGQGGWVEAQLARIAPAEPFAAGTAIPFEGAEIMLHWEEALPRGPALTEGRLQCGGSAQSFSGRVERFLRREARDRLSKLTRQIAHDAGLSVRSVAVGDASSRWGSCSSSGAIRYNWRLVLAPLHLSRWVVAHEVAHLRHMNHGPAFKALEAELYGADPRPARAELRALGPRLKRVGRPL